ncbi:MAG TPA: glycosyltransferase family 1 protein [Lacunisphaera sp.]|nr:glycosyltransferase family 1 protein [Lacunisphaera sp.]
MLLIDTTHTSHTRAQTGIQRVTRSLFAAVRNQQPTAAVCYDPYVQAWRKLHPAELRRLEPGLGAGQSRGAKWPWHQRIAGRARRALGVVPPAPRGEALVCPELFSATTGAHLAGLFAAVSGPRVAIFHDAIALKLPELSPPGMVARLPAYLRELLAFDGVAAVSRDSAESLRDYWSWLGVARMPEVTVIAHGLDPLPPTGSEAAAPARPRILCVGTIEGRKNHLALLDACESLWAEGLEFELQLFGLARADTAGRALARLKELQRAGRPLLYGGVADDATLQAAYRACAFTVYPSIMEGFGLPVLESLQHGKPCVCSSRGALGEAASGGGCLALDKVDAAGLAAAMRRLLSEPAELAVLAAGCRARKLRTWMDAANDISAWMRDLPRRA